MVLVALRTGLRYSNIKGLRWNHIDFENQMFRMKAAEMKSKRDWTLPIANDLFRILVDIYERCKKSRTPSIYVFPGKKTDTVKDIRHSFKNVIRRNGLPQIRFHDLRGTFLTRIAPHTDPKTLQQIADHSSIQTTMKFYVHTDMKRVGKALEDAFGG
jgi:integrase